MTDPWDTCIFKCESPDPTDLTPAHVIQESIGGRWAPPVMCRDCNSRAGSTFEKHVKYADTVLLSMEVVWGVIPDAPWKRQFRAGQRYIIVKDDGSKTRAFYKKGEVKVAPGEQSDGSHVFASDKDARGFLHKELRATGASEDDVAAALIAYDEADDGDTIRIGVEPGARTLRKLTNTDGEVRIAYTGPVTFLPCEAVHFMAFSALAGLIGPAIYDERFDAIRQLVRHGGADPDLMTIDAIKGVKRGQIAMHHIQACTRDDGYSVQITLFCQHSYEVIFHVEPMGEWCAVGHTDIADTMRDAMEWRTDAPLDAVQSGKFLWPPGIDGFERGRIQYKPGWS
ncbi:MAG: hypothetical protein KDC46_07610 [Thermoleophilia bacterium]|nr:hypothetical protein [Thermoleophilia bacterium]